MTAENKNLFIESISGNDLVKVADMLKQFPDFAKIDLRPKKDQNHFTNGFALVEACKVGNFEIAKILLEHGADPNSRGSNESDPPEFGIPICLAVEDKNYRLAHLLLDFDASVDAFPYCDAPMIEKLYYQARLDGVDPFTLRKGFSKYLGDVDIHTVPTNSPESIKLYYRILNVGVEPSIRTVIRDEHLNLIGDFLKICPKQECTKLTYPKGTFYERIIGSASWNGYPKIVKMCLDLCPELCSNKLSRDSIHSAIISHNRDGSTDDYIAIIKLQLEFIKSKGKLNWIIHEEPLYPFFTLAKDFLNKSRYGGKAPLTNGTDLIRLAKLFLAFGFDDYNKKHPEEKMTPLEKAKTRLDFEGMSDYIDFLNTLE